VAAGAPQGSYPAAHDALLPPAAANDVPVAAAAVDMALMSHLLQQQSYLLVHQQMMELARLPPSRAVFSGDAASGALVHQFHEQLDDPRVLSLLMPLIPDRSLRQLRLRVDALVPAVPLLVQGSLSAAACGAVLQRLLRRADLAATDLPHHRANHIVRMTKLLQGEMERVRELLGLGGEEPRRSASSSSGAAPWWRRHGTDWLLVALQAATAWERGDFAWTPASAAAHPSSLSTPPPQLSVATEPPARPQSTEPTEETKEQPASAVAIELPHRTDTPDAASATTGPPPSSEAKSEVRVAAGETQTAATAAAATSPTRSTLKFAAREVIEID